jgi:selenide,water dikinase
MIKLTQYSHGAGCGCKIAPDVLDRILTSNMAMPGDGRRLPGSNTTPPGDSRLLVGNHSKDDAAVYDLGNGTALISTTDFFMPIVDDPFRFGRIAAANAISDVYAMGGKPVLAIAILGWPVNTLPPEIAQQVVAGGRSICEEAGIPLAGGHSIDSPEPIFGLAVNGIVDIDNIKRNSTGAAGNILFLTKRLGVGILTTAEKKGILKEAHRSLAATQMEQLNKVGEALGKITGVTAMTDVTGFGLLGHLTEICEGSGVSATIDFDKVPLITEDLASYIGQGSIPGGTGRNWDSYGGKITFSDNIDPSFARAILADPQTSGGLLIAVSENAVREVQGLLKDYALYDTPIGMLAPKSPHLITVR